MSKILGLKNGNNEIKFSASKGIDSADFVCTYIDAVSNTDGTISIKRKIARLDTEFDIGSITVTNGVGHLDGIVVPICAYDTIVVSGAPVGDSAIYSLRMVSK